MPVSFLTPYLNTLDPVSWPHMSATSSIYLFLKSYFFPQIFFDFSEFACKLSCIVLGTKQAQKGFWPLSATQAIGYFQNPGNLLGIFWELFGNFFVWKLIVYIFKVSSLFTLLKSADFSHSKRMQGIDLYVKILG